MAGIINYSFAGKTFVEDVAVNVALEIAFNMELHTEFDMHFDDTIEMALEICGRINVDKLTDLIE